MYKRKKITENEENYIIQLFKDGYNTVQIGEKINRSDVVIGRVLKRNELYPKYTKVILSQKNKESICNLYNQGLTMTEIKNKYSCCETPIKRVLVENNIQIREAKRRSTCGTHDYFKCIDNQNKAYFLGLMITDGSIIKDKRENKSLNIAIELKEEDIYIIEKFKEEIKGTMKIVKSRNCYRLQFASEQMANDLSKYGVVQNKTFKTYLPNLDESLMPHLIRGIFDGDGTVYESPNKYGNLTLRFGLYGSNKLCNEVKEYLNFNTFKVFDKGTVSFFVTSHKGYIKQFYDYIYKNAETYLIRKKILFDKYMQTTTL